MPEDLLAAEAAGITGHADADGTTEPGADLEFDHWSSKIAYSPWDIWSRMRNAVPGGPH